jgi:hypothetical protein
MNTPDVILTLREDCENSAIGRIGVNGDGAAHTVLRSGVAVRHHPD